MFSCQSDADMTRFNEDGGGVLKGDQMDEQTEPCAGAANLEE
jgi:hypothetical protein